MVHTRLVVTLFLVALVISLPLPMEPAFGQGPQAPGSDQSAAKNRAPVVVGGRTLLVTRIRTIKNVDISIPNAMVLSSHIVN